MQTTQLNSRHFNIIGRETNQKGRAGRFLSMPAAGAGPFSVLAWRGAARRTCENAAISTNVCVLCLQGP